MRANLRVKTLVSLIALSHIFSSCTYTHVVKDPDLGSISQNTEFLIGSTFFDPFLNLGYGQLQGFDDTEQYLQSVLDRLISFNTNLHHTATVGIEDSNQLNIWSLPGNKIAISWGMLLEVNSEAKIASLFSHELAHQHLRHSLKKSNNQLYNSFHKLQKGKLNVCIADLYDDYTSTPFSQEQEDQAHELAVQILKRAGYDVSEYINIFHRLSQTNPDKTPYTSLHLVTKDNWRNLSDLYLDISNSGIVNVKEYSQNTRSLQELNNLFKQLQYVDALVQKSQFQEALNQVNNIEKSYSFDYLPLIKTKAILLDRIGEPQKGYKVVLKALDLAPNCPTMLTLTGVLSYKIGKFNQAIKYLKESNNLEYSDLTSYFLYKAQLERGLKEQALDGFKKLAQTQSTYWSKKAAYKMLQIDLVEHPEHYFSIRKTHAPNEILIKNLYNYDFSNLKIQILQNGRQTYGSSAHLKLLKGYDAVTVQLPSLVSESSQLTLQIDAWN